MSLKFASVWLNAYSHACSCLGQKSSLGVFLNRSSLCYRDRFSSWAWSWMTWPVWQASKLQASPCSGITNACYSTWLPPLHIYIRDSYRITKFLHFFSSLQILLYNSPTLNLWPSFCFTNYYMHMCIFTYISISKYVCSVCRLLPICMFSGMTVWHWTTVWCALPWGRPALPFPAFLSYL